MNNKLTPYVFNYIYFVQATVLTRNVYFVWYYLKVWKIENQFLMWMNWRPAARETWISIRKKEKKKRKTGRKKERKEGYQTLRAG